MSKRNTLQAAPPFAIEQSLKKLGERLRTARLRRSLTLEEAAAKIGTGIRAVRDAENGRASASIGTYWALLWAYDLLGPAEDLADPAKDAEGSALETRRFRAGGRGKSALDNDF
ncbi:MAG: helix-turn-helix domain-containing protein [Acetobacteraceae bacterium]